MQSVEGNARRDARLARLTVGSQFSRFLFHGFYFSPFSVLVGCQDVWTVLCAVCAQLVVGLDCFGQGLAS